MTPFTRNASMPGEGPGASGLAQAQGAHEFGAHPVSGAKEDHETVIFGSTEDLRRALAAGAFGQNRDTMDPNRLVLLGFVVQRSSINHMLSKLADALPAVWRFDDAGDEVAAPSESVHHEQQGPAAHVVSQGADDAHAEPPPRVNWLFTEGSVPLSGWPEEVGNLPARMVLSPRIGAWLDHLVCLELEPQKEAR